jgi:hypothetical protein
MAELIGRYRGLGGQECKLGGQCGVGGLAKDSVALSTLYTLFTLAAKSTKFYSEFADVVRAISKTGGRLRCLS